MPDYLSGARCVCEGQCLIQVVAAARPVGSGSGNLQKAYASTTYGDLPLDDPRFF